MPDLLTALGLALNAFLSATLLPGASEALLAGLVATGRGEPAALVAIAAGANTLGSAVNWLLGRLAERFRDRRWFPTSPAALERGARLFNRYGLALLLLAWLPVVGDALTVAAGVLRVPFLLFLPLVALGKLARYALVAMGAAALVPA